MCKIQSLLVETSVPRNAVSEYTTRDSRIPCNVMALYLLNYGVGMALLVKERKALEQLEQAFINYLTVVLGQNPEEIDIDSSKSPEERLLYLSVLLNSSY